MLDLTTEFPDEETYMEAVNRCIANIRDNLADIEAVYTRLTKGQVFMDAEEVAKLVHCTVEALPARLPYYRVGRRKLYKKCDISEWIESCKKSR